jgi:hypothetical protein
VRAGYLSDIREAEKLRIIGEISEPLQVALAARLPITRLRALAKLPDVLNKYVPPGIAKADHPAWNPSEGTGDNK